MMKVLLDCYITFAIAITAVGLLIWAWVNFRKGIKTLKWVRVEGEVISSKVEQTGTTIEFNHPTYQTRATVKYEVDGRMNITSNVDDFIGTVESIGKPSAPPKKSKAYVYYNPEKPGEAVLDRAALKLSIFLGLLGIGFIALEWHWVSRTFF